MEIGVRERVFDWFMFFVQSHSYLKSSLAHLIDFQMSLIKNWLCKQIFKSANPFPQDSWNFWKNAMVDNMKLSSDTSYGTSLTMCWHKAAELGSKNSYKASIDIKMCRQVVERDVTGPNSSWQDACKRWSRTGTKPTRKRMIAITW